MRESAWDGAGQHAHAHAAHAVGWTLFTQGLCSMTTLGVVVCARFCEGINMERGCKVSETANCRLQAPAHSYARLRTHMASLQAWPIWQS